MSKQGHDVSGCMFFCSSHGQSISDIQDMLGVDGRPASKRVIAGHCLTTFDRDGYLPTHTASAGLARSSMGSGCKIQLCATAPIYRDM